MCDAQAGINRCLQVRSQSCASFARRVCDEGRAASVSHQCWEHRMHRTGLLPNHAGDMVVGKHYFGAVSSVTDFGVFVRFMGSCSALALLGQLSESFVTDPREVRVLEILKLLLHIYVSVTIVR